MIMKLFTLLVFLFTFNLAISAESPICCTPDQWEADVFWDNGNIFYDGKSKSSASNVGTFYAYINGTARTAYDFNLGRTFIQVAATEITPLMPQPQMENVSVIRDFKNGVQYQIQDGQCAAAELPVKLQRHCVPGSATNLGNGFLESTRVPVSTFAYTFTVDFPYKVQSTVTKNDTVCLPVHVTYLMVPDSAGAGAVNNMEYFDVTPGIKVPSIFNIPPQCKHAKITQPDAVRSRFYLYPFL